MGGWDARSDVGSLAGEDPAGIGAPWHSKPLRIARIPNGQALKSRTEALDTPCGSTPDLLPPRGSVDKESVLTVAEKGTVREIKEWPAIMDYLRGLPAKNEGERPTIPVDDRAAEVRAIKAG